MYNGKFSTSAETLQEKYSPYWSMLVSASLEISDAGRVQSETSPQRQYHSHTCIRVWHGVTANSAKLWGGNTWTQQTFIKNLLFSGNVLDVVN